MSRTLRIIIGLAVIAAFGAAVLLKESRRGAAEPAVEIAATSEDVAGDIPAAPTGPLPKLIDLGSTYCVPCKMMAPILEELGNDYRDRFEVVVIDVRQDRTAAGLYGIRVIPTQIFYDAEGRELFRHEGFMSKEAILGQWESLGIPVGGAATTEQEEGA